MTHPMHDSVVSVVEGALGSMDRFLRSKIDLEAYGEELNQLEVDDILVRYEDDFKRDPSLVYYLDALMLLSSLQHELDFQVSEYGANVATEDVKNLNELLRKFPRD